MTNQQPSGSEGNRPWHEVPYNRKGKGRATDEQDRLAQHHELFASGNSYKADSSRYGVLMPHDSKVTNNPLLANEAGQFGASLPSQQQGEDTAMDQGPSASVITKTARNQGPSASVIKNTDIREAEDDEFDEDPSDGRKQQRTLELGADVDDQMDKAALDASADDLRVAAMLSRTSLGVDEPATKRAKAAPGSGNVQKAWENFQAKAKRGMEAKAAELRAKGQQSLIQASTSQQSTQALTEADATFQTPSHQGKYMAEQQQVSKPAHLDFPSFFASVGSSNCAVMIEPSSKEMPPVTLGKLFDRDAKISITLRGDGGKYGLPRIELRFALQQPGEPKQLSVWWRPGVKYQKGKYDISDLQYMSYMDLLKKGAGSAKMQQPAVFEGLQPQLRQKVYCMWFTSNHATRAGRLSQSEMDFLQLNVTAQQTLYHLFGSAEPCGILLWVLPQTNPETMERSFFEPMRNFVNGRIPPLCQYMDKAGRLMTHWKNMPKVYEMGKCMYVQSTRADGSPANIFKFPLKTSHDIYNEWALSIIVPVIRNVQFARAQLNHLEAKAHHLLITSTEQVLLPGMSKTLTVPADYYGVVRVKRTDGKLGRMPDRGTIIYFDFDTTDRYADRVHVPSPRYQRLHGRVVNNDAGCKETGTQFCVSLKKPEKFPGSINPLPVKFYPNDRLPLVWLEPELDLTSAQRDLAAALKFTDKTYLPETLQSYRAAFTMPVSSMPRLIQDLSLRNPDIWALYRFVALEDSADNPSQQDVLTSLEHVADGVVVVAGPPGAGKTKSLVALVIALVLLGYKVLVSGPSNAAVNKDAVETMKAYISLAERLRLPKSFIRLEVRGVELRAMVRVKDWMSGSSSDDLMHVSEIDDEGGIEDDLEVATALDDVAQGFDEKDQRFQQLQEEFGSWYQAMERFRQEEVRRDIGVPRIMTTGHHLFELSAIDEITAAQEW